MHREVRAKRKQTKAFHCAWALGVFNPCDVIVTNKMTNQDDDDRDEDDGDDGDGADGDHATRPWVPTWFRGHGVAARRGDASKLPVASKSRVAKLCQSESLHGAVAIGRPGISVKQPVLLHLVGIPGLFKG